MQLNTIATGPADPSLPIVLAHGLFGQARNLGGLARRLAADGRRVIAVDMRNHGDSPHSETHDYPAMADDLARVIDAHGGRADLAGHSMGGKAAMMLALRHPDMLRRLAVLDIAPVRYGHSQNGLIDAMETLDLAHLTRRSEADSALAGAIPDAGIRAFLLQSLDLKATPPQWRLNLPVLRRAMPDLVGWPEAPAQSAFAGPVLALAGAASDYVTAEGANAIRAMFPQARIVRIKGAGHWLHADAPEATADALAQFFAA